MRSAAADGEGYSLVPVNPNLNPDPNNPLNWRASAAIGGSPGADDPPSNIPAVWITEVLTHTDLPQVDSIELYNPGTNTADISFWFLTDNLSDPAKFQIPPGTTLAPKSYRVFTEANFNQNPGAATKILVQAILAIAFAEAIVFYAIFLVK